MASTHNKTARHEKHASETIITDTLSLIEDIVVECNDDFEGCVSVREIGDWLGRDGWWVRIFIRKCIEAGMCEFVGKRVNSGIDGRIVKTPVYRFNFKNKDQ